MNADRQPHLEFAIPDNTKSPAMVRGCVEQFLSSRSPRLRSAAALVASELVTNALRHSKPPLRATFDDFGDRDLVRIAISDGQCGAPESRVASGSGGGFGTHILDGLCVRWGHDEEPDGKTVWCELDAGQ